VADGQGVLAVIPKACHQHVVKPEDEVGIQATVYRELFEEIYGRDEPQVGCSGLTHDWYFEVPPLKYFREHEGGYKNEIVGFGLNAVTGNYEFAMLLAVLDTWYWNTFSRQANPNWEQAGIEAVSSKDPSRIASLLLTGNWAPESVFHFVEGLMRLRAIEPSRVNLPDLHRELVTD